MKLRASLAAVVALVLVTVAPQANGGGATTITTCGQTVITDAVLTQDLVCTGSGVIVGASGITVDLKGFTIRGDRGLGDYGIDDSGGFDSVTIKNGVLRNFNECINAATNVTIADKLTVQNMVVSANASRGIIVRGNAAKIQSTIASGNGEGILVIGDLASIKSVTAHGHTGGTGVRVVGNSASIQSTIADGNGGGGTVQGSSASIKSVTASGNSGNGIYVDGGSPSIQSSTAIGNGGPGITVIGDDASLKNNHADANGLPNASDLTGLGITVTNYTTPPAGKNTARGNDDPAECSPTYLC